MGKSYNFENTGALSDIAAKYGYTLPDSIPLNNSAARASFFSSLYNNMTSLASMQENNAFNAEQAQISREWNSEPQVMERRREAGLHMVNPSGGSSGGSSGGGSVPASSVPVPNLSQPSFQSNFAGFADIMQAGVEVAKAPFDILKTDATAKESLANVGKLNAEAGLATAQSGYTKVLTQLKPEEVGSLLAYQSSQTEFNEASINQVHAIADYYQQQTFNVFLDGLLGIQDNEMDLESRINDIQKNYAGFELDSYKYSQSLEKSILDGSFQFGDHVSNSKGGTASRHLGFDVNEFHTFGGSGGFGPSHAGFKSPKIDISPLLSGASVSGGATDGDSTTRFNTQFNTNMTNRVSEFYYQNRDYIDLGKKITGTAFLLQRSYNPKVIQQSLINLRGLERSWQIYQRAKELYRMQRPQSANFMGE